MILKFAQKVAKEAHRVTDMEIKQLRELGFSDEDLIDLVGTIALGLANYVIIDTLDLPVSDWMGEEIIIEQKE